MSELLQKRVDRIAISSFLLTISIDETIDKLHGLYQHRRPPD